MNILVVCHYGLYENLSFSFVHNQVREFVNLGHNVRVLCPIGIGKKNRNGKRFSLGCKDVTVDGVQIFDIPYITLSSYGEKGFNTKSAIASIKLHKNALKDFEPDIIHAHTLGFDSNIGAWLKQKFNCKLVVTTHGGDTFVPFINKQRHQLKSYADKADTVVCVSSLLKNRLIDCNVTTELKVILNGFNTRFTSYSENKTAYSVIQVGNLIPRKKNDITIRAISILKSKYPQIHLTIVGSGPELPNLIKLVQELNLESSIEFKGQLDNKDVHSLLSKSTLFVMPSVEEGFGIVYLEAMAAGCITIGTQGEGIADVIEDGENGFLVPADSPEAIAEKIEYCIENKNSALTVSEKGTETAKNLTWYNNVCKYVELFNDLKKS